jgi:hypothetical protein
MSTVLAEFCCLMHTLSASRLYDFQKVTTPLFKVRLHGSLAVLPLSEPICMASWEAATWHVPLTQGLTA